MKLDEAMLVGASGIWPSSDAGVFIPRAAIAGLDLRQWTRDHVSCVSVSILLTDGRYVQVPGLSRDAHPYHPRVPGPTVQFTRGGAEETWWSDLQGPVGPLSGWTEWSDELVLSAVRSQVLETLGGFGDDPAAADGLKLRTLVDLGPMRTGTQFYSSLFLGAYQRRSTRLPEPRPYGPKALPPKPRSMVRELEIPQWTDLGFPAIYWSRASRRLLWHRRRRSGVGFTRSSVVLRKNGGWESIPLSDVDRFDIVLLRDGTAWRLRLVLADGSFRELDGIDHGLWASSLRLTGNELRWCAGGETGRDGLPRSRAAAGRLRWGSDDDALIAARFNAQLAAARRWHR